MINVLLAEDDEVFRIGLTVALKQSEQINLIATATDGQAAITLAEEYQPDLILMDIGMPVLSGIEATRNIKARFPQMKVLVLTSHSDAKLVEQMMEAGADGFCLKGISTERLLSLVQEVHDGAFWIDAAVAQQIKHYFQGSTKPASSEQISSPSLEGLETLTEREQEVLALIAQGRKNLEIADLLCISPGTVRVHVHSILNKLNVKDRTQAALFVMRKQSS